MSPAELGRRSEASLRGAAAWCALLTAIGLGACRDASDGAGRDVDAGLPDGSTHLDAGATIGTDASDGQANDATTDAGRDCETDVCGAPCAAPGRCLVRLASDCASWAPCNVAVDDTNVYWTDGSDGTVMKMPKGGAPPSVIASGQAGACQIAVFSGSVYWTACKAGTVMAMPVDGGAATQLASAPGECPCTLAVGSAGVFYATDYAIMKVGAGGASVRLLDWMGVFGIALDASHIYWAGHTALRGTLAGDSIGSVGYLAPAGYDAWSVALDDTHVYLGISSIGAGPGAVMRVPKGSSTAQTLSAGQPYRVAVDDNDVYWTDSDKVMKVSKQGGSALVLAEGQNARAIAVDDTSVYWTTDDAVMMLTPK